MLKFIFILWTNLSFAATLECLPKVKAIALAPKARATIEQLAERKSAGLTTERLSLRILKPGDEKKFAEVINDGQAGYFGPGATPGEKNRLLEQAKVPLSEDILGGSSTFAIYKTDGEGPIGMITVGFSHGREKLNLGYILSKEARGQGLATEAVNAVVAQIKEIGGEDLTIEAVANRNNQFSMAVLRRAGFRQVTDNPNAIGIWFEK